MPTIQNSITDSDCKINESKVLEGGGGGGETNVSQRNEKLPAAGRGLRRSLLFLSSF